MLQVKISQSQHILILVVRGVLLVLAPQQILFLLESQVFKKEMLIGLSLLVQVQKIQSGLY
jgi:hypothetical protein